MIVIFAPLQNWDQIRNVYQVEFSGRVRLSWAILTLCGFILLINDSEVPLMQSWDLLSPSREKVQGTPDVSQKARSQLLPFTLLYGHGAHLQLAKPSYPCIHYLANDRQNNRSPEYGRAWLDSIHAVRSVLLDAAPITVIDMPHYFTASHSPPPPYCITVPYKLNP